VNLPPTYLLRLEDLRRSVEHACERLGMPAQEGKQVADVLLDSELRGHESHGVHMVGWLVDSVRDGQLNPRPNVRVLRETETTLLLEGDRGPVVASSRAMRWCIERTRERGGIAIAAVRNTQLIVPGFFARLAAEAGLIGYACTNAVPMLAPPGGLTRTLGTNPFAYAVPAGRYPPIVLDIASTSGAAFKVRLAAHRGKAVPHGWVLDASGRPSTDPRAFDAGGFMAPLGSPSAPHKGFGLALVVDVLGGILSGGASGLGLTDDPGGTGNLLWALDPRAFLPAGELQARVDGLIEQVKGGRRIEETAELLVPGEWGQRRLDALLARGLAPLSAATWERLVRALKSLGAPPPPLMTNGPAFSNEMPELGK
jgi:LDH2 family malate/lactate/ureidoglycolate dehydrogenase